MTRYRSRSRSRGRRSRSRSYDRDVYRRRSRRDSRDADDFGRDGRDGYESRRTGDRYRDHRRDNDRGSPRRFRDEDRGRGRDGDRYGSGSRVADILSPEERVKFRNDTQSVLWPPSDNTDSESEDLPSSEKEQTKKDARSRIEEDGHDSEDGAKEDSPKRRSSPSPRKPDSDAKDVPTNGSSARATTDEAESSDDRSPPENKETKEPRKRRSREESSDEDSDSDNDRKRKKKKSKRSKRKSRRKSSKKKKRSKDSDTESSADESEQEPAVDIDAKEAELFKEAVQGGKHHADDDDEEVGPKPLSAAQEAASKSVNYGGALMPGEGAAIAQYVQKNMRIPRRGEVGWQGGEIERLETLGYVMSGSRHTRMNAIRIRKENQVYSAEEKRALALINFEERQQRENTLLGEFRAMLTGGTAKDATEEEAK